MRTDDELMVAHARGDLGAFDELVHRYQAPLLGFLRSLLRDEALAEDALIEALLKVHGAAATFEPTGRFRAWLYTVAYREGVTLVRRRTKGVNAHAVAEDGAALTCHRPRPDASLEQRQALQAVEAVLGGLPEVQRAVFVLFYREGMATADIAAAVDIPAGSVRAYLSMARKAIREALTDEGAWA